jgi:hypothetical protein
VTNLWEVPISRTFEITAAPRRLTLSTESQHQPSIGPNGRLLFATHAGSMGFWQIPIENGAPVPDAVPESVTSYSGHGLLSVSEDGRRLVFTRRHLGNPEIWVRDLQTGAEKALVASSGEKDFPVLTRDGRRVFYSSMLEGRSAIHSVPVPGGTAEKVCDACGQPTDCSRDQKMLIVQQQLPANATLAVLDLGSGRQTEILKSDRYAIYRGHLSPDERWIVFHVSLTRSAIASDDPVHLEGKREFIAPFRGATPVKEDEWIAITDGTTLTDAPRWSPSGNELYFISSRDGFTCIWGQRLEPRTKHPQGEPFPVLHLHQRQRSIANIDVAWTDLAVARDRLLFGAGELKGNIWSMDAR